MNSDTLHRRLREMRSRVAIRKWEARQAGLAGGVWFRFTLLLASARRAIAISTEQVAMLRAAGFVPSPVGGQLEPPKLLFVIAEEKLPRSISGDEVALQDLRRILLAPALVLIPFAADARAAY